MRPSIWTTFAEAITRPVSRRTLIQGAAGGAAVTALAATHGLVDDAATADEAPAAEPRRHELTLTASEFDHELMPGVVVRAWGYDGSMPGPELRVTEGDTVRVTLRNELPVPTTIHWHGLNVRNAMNGVAGLTQAPVEPGGRFVYEFVATPAGTRWYHSHTDPAFQVAMGLYGALIVEPRQPAAAHDREHTLVLAEWDGELTPAVAAGLERRGPRDATLRGGELGADLFLINGRMHGAIEPIRIAEGERVLIRLIHTGSIPHPIHIHGHSFKIVATDGNPVPEVAQLTKDTVLIGPAERYDLSLLGDNPGVWMVHCHIEHHMAAGMMTTLWYDGSEPTGPYDAYAMDTGAAGDPGTDHGPDHGTPADPTSTPAAPDEAGAVEVSMVDDRFQPTALTVAVLTTVAWVNHGAQEHSVAAYDGSFESGKIPPGERFLHRFTAAGTYRYICKHHGMQGMLGTVTVDDPSAMSGGKEGDGAGTTHHEH